MEQVAHEEGAQRTSGSSGAPARITFSRVENGWDPAEVLEFIADLEDRLRTMLALRPVEEPAAPDGMLAAAEHDAEAMRVRASDDAERARSRALDEARATQIEAKRMALDMVESGREVADAIVARAREQEESLYARVAELRNVVRRTEQLLVSVSAGAPEVMAGSEAEPDVGIALETDEPGPVAATSARMEARRVPPEVRQLLDQLQAPDAR